MLKFVEPNLKAYIYLALYNNVIYTINIQCCVWYRVENVRVKFHIIVSCITLYMTLFHEILSIFLPLYQTYFRILHINLIYKNLPPILLYTRYTGRYYGAALLLGMN